MTAARANWWKTLLKTSSLIGLSKVFGFLRDVVIAAYFGTSKAADAFNFAYLFTGNLFILLGGLNGPFHSAIVSTLGHINSGNNELPLTKGLPENKRENSFLTAIFVRTFLIFAILSVVLWLLMKFFFKVILSKQPALIASVLTQTELMLPVFILTGLIGLLFGTVSYKGHYFWPSVSPLISSILLIATILLGFNYLGPWVLGIGTTLGAIFQGLVQFIDLWKLGFRFDRLELDLKNIFFPFQNGQVINPQSYADIAHFNTILFPALLSSTIGSLNVYVDSFFCAGLQEGSWTAILTANRLIQLPFGILVGSSLVSFLPRITALKDKPNEFGSSLKREVFNLLILLIPATALLFALSGPIIQILFQRGEFTNNSTNLVNITIIGLSASLITALPREIFTRAFYAIGDSKTPMFVSLISIVWNALLDWWLGAKFQVAGIALSTTITAFINSTLLVFLLNRKMDLKGKFNWLESLYFVAAGLISFFIASKVYALCNAFGFLKQWDTLVSFVNLGQCISVGLAAILSLCFYLGCTLAYKKFREVKK